ncbi:hypothetical protein [Lachnoanaerobaculum gingivalis]|uniref:Uncharacterized protein n=1 Tax=Lachnoanaerobaculum gingivalis TaxID=2490855 RepID=A0A3P3R145_9FIRM|nr:hypothetical protein [Lachnoanaerobaculum gingivalis]RRJ26579.1 hypothetical protein EHV10_00680 [Lachnoanaerobaculum gingivalis]
MVYLIVDKKNENDFEKINYYKIYLQNIYHDDVECIIEDNRVITPLGKEGEALEEKGRIVRKKLSGAKAVYLLRDKELTVLRI